MFLDIIVIIKTNRQIFDLVQFRNIFICRINKV